MNAAERSRIRRRRLIVAAICVVVAVVLWNWVFPWVDRTYVNRPEIGGF